MILNCWLEGIFCSRFSHYLRSIPTHVFSLLLACLLFCCVVLQIGATPWRVVVSRRFFLFCLFVFYLFVC